MTREEAIQALYSTDEAQILNIDGNPTIIYSSKRIEAVEMAIKALEQDSCEDCISRNGLMKHECKTQSDGLTQAVVVAIESFVEQMPSVYPARRKGKLITTRTFQHDGEFYCDKCKCDSPQNERWDFCPNCGADMRRE